MNFEHNANQKGTLAKKKLSKIVRIEIRDLCNQTQY